VLVADSWAMAAWLPYRERGEKNGELVALIFFVYK